MEGRPWEMGWAGWALVFPGQWLGPGGLGKVALPGRGSWETPGEEAQHGGLPGETRGRPTMGRESRAGGVGQRGLPDRGYAQGIGRVGALTRGWAVEEPETIPKEENREVRAAIRVCMGVSVCAGV